jgi:hypothetical protein
MGERKRRLGERERKKGVGIGTVEWGGKAQINEGNEKGYY